MLSKNLDIPSLGLHIYKISHVARRILKLDRADRYYIF